MLIVLAADLSPNSANRQLVLSTYRALKSVPDHNVVFLRSGDQIEHIKANRFPSMSITEIKDAVIITFRDITSYISIDRSNKLVYLATHGMVESYMSFMINRVDCVIATNYRSAYKICLALQQLDIHIPVYRLAPWMDTDDTSLSHTENKLRVLVQGDTVNIRPLLARQDIEISHTGAENIAGWSKVNAPDWSRFDIFICLDGDDIAVRKAMLSGVIPIVRDKLPYPEFIIDAYNGFFVYSPNNIIEIIERLKNTAELESVKLSTYRSAHLQQSKSRWAKQFMATVNGFGADNVYEPDLFTASKPTYRRWIVPKAILEGGQTLQIPRLYSKSNFKVVELPTIEDILTFFSSQRFLDVYVFDWEYVEHNADNYNRMMNMSRALGKRGLNIFWCTDRPIPKEWSAVFSTMTILSVEEGLKRVRPSNLPAQVR